MNISSIAFAAAIALAGATFTAQAAPETAYPGTFVDTPSTLTRAQVKSEVLKAQARGDLLVADFKSPATPAIKSNRSRADVRAEAMTANNERGMLLDRAYAN